jgi:hypothetical protein
MQVTGSPSVITEFGRSLAPGVSNVIRQILPGSSDERRKSGLVDSAVGEKATDVAQKFRIIVRPEVTEAVIEQLQSRFQAASSISTTRAPRACKPRLQ